MCAKMRPPCSIPPSGQHRQHVRPPICDERRRRDATGVADEIEDRPHATHDKSPCRPRTRQASLTICPPLSRIQSGACRYGSLIGCVSRRTIHRSFAPTTPRIGSSRCYFLRATPCRSIKSMSTRSCSFCAASFLSARVPVSEHSPRRACSISTPASATKYARSASANSFYAWLLGPARDTPAKPTRRRSGTTKDWPWRRSTRLASHSDIIIRVSGVRVPPPALPEALYSSDLQDIRASGRDRPVSPAVSPGGAAGAQRLRRCGGLPADRPSRSWPRTCKSLGRSGALGVCKPYARINRNDTT
jgi:hypothetical protein